MVRSFPNNNNQENLRYSGDNEEDDSEEIDLLNIKLFPDEINARRSTSFPKITVPVPVSTQYNTKGHPLENSQTKLVANISNLPRGYGDICPNKKESSDLLLLYSKKDRRPYSATTTTEPVKPDNSYPSKTRATQIVDIVSEDRISKFVSRNNKVDAGFPFKFTPSGNLKVESSQVVFSTNKLSVLVADPKKTKVNIHPQTNYSKEMAQETDLSKTSAIDTILSQAGISSLGTIMGHTPVRVGRREASEYESKQTSEILDPELHLGRLGYTENKNINWNRVALPEKKNLYLELYSRITNYTNADCKVYIDNEEFSCHLIVLQCYSELFDAYIAVKRVELPSDKCSAAAFAFIYEWMLTGEPSYKELTRENVLDIFMSAKYLKIKDLVEQCWAFIDHFDVFNEDTAFMLYMDAKRKNLEEVMQIMLPRIQAFFLMLVSSQNWLDLELDDVKCLLKSNYIAVNSEMEIFMSAVRWLKHDWASRDQHKYEVLECVRFGNIAPWQLVDIKRNPENPDFMELAKDPRICKMIDDGLAYVIIKYWYGQENDDFQHWNMVLGLQEPASRNWSGSDKTYFTYREFLIYLDQYRRNQLLEKNKPRVWACDKGDCREVGMLEYRSQPGASTMDDHPVRKKTPDTPTSSSKKSEPSISRTKAAIIIQRAYRNFLKRRLLTKECHKKPKKTEMLKKTKKGVLSMFNMVKNHFDNDHKSDQSWFQRKNLLEDNSLFHEVRETVLVFGGLDTHNPYGFDKNTAKEIYRFMPIGNFWDYVGDMPEPRHHHCITFYKGRIVVAGGSDPRGNKICKDAKVCNTVWSFDPVVRKWFEEEPMYDSRKNFGLIGCSQGLFAFGGQTDEYQVLNSVEKYVVEKRTWEQMSPMINARTGFAYAKIKNNIWVAGGLSGNDTSSDILDSIESYDIRCNQWTLLNFSLRFPRCYTTMQFISDKLYLIGGACKSVDKQKGDCTSSNGSVDLWDENKLEWKEIAQLNIPRHGQAVSYLGTQILIIGGVTTAYGRALSNMECFCTQRETWVRGLACLPTPLSGHAVVTLPPASLLTF